MTITANYPTVKPSLILDFTKGQALDPRISFSRAASSAYYYDGKTSVLAEQNLFTYSQDYTNAVWAKNNITNTGASTTAPDGTTTGSLIDDGLSAGFHVLQYSVATNGTVTVSGYAKNITRQYVGLIVFGAGGASTYISAVFDLVNTTNTTSQNGAGYSVTSATMTSVGNGWYRCVLSGTVSSATLMAMYPSNNATAGYVPSYTGTNQQFYAWGAQLEQRSSVTAYNATTTAAITNYIPQIQSAGTNIPRFDYNPATGESLGFLIEQSSTNLVNYSQLFNNAAWDNNAGSVSINATAGIAPDGTQTANLVTESTGTTEHHVAESYTFSASTAHTASIYIKQVYGSRNIRILFYTNSAADQATVIFNASTGAVVSAASAVGSMTAVSATATLLGNGFWRFTLTGTTSATAGAGAIRYQMMNGTTASYTGDGWSSLFYWGAQLEALAFPTSYIPTTSAQATRAQDSATIAGTNFSSWYNQGQGTFYVNFSRINTGSATAYPALFTTDTLLEFADGTYEVIKSNPANIQYSASSVTKLERKSIFAYSPSVGIASAIDGGNYLSNSSAPITNKSTTYFTFGGLAGNPGSNYIKKIAYYPQALTQAQLQSLTV